MAISNYSELQAAIASWINRTDMGGVIPDFIRLAEAKIATEFKTQQLTVITTFNVDAESELLPSNYKGAISAHLVTDPKTRLDYFSPDEFEGRYMGSSTGKPSAYTIKGGSIFFAPVPDGTYSCKLLHYATPDLATTTTNSLLSNYPNLYLFASLVEALDYNEEDSSRYQRKYFDALQNAMLESDYNGALAIQLGDIE